VFDGKLARFGLFAGDGTFLGHELTDDPKAVSTCADAFEQVWERATRTMTAACLVLARRLICCRACNAVGGLGCVLSCVSGFGWWWRSRHGPA
jgi:hypothetical protein